MDISINKTPKKFDYILKEMRIKDPFYNGFTYYGDIISRHLRLAEYIRITHSKKDQQNA